MPEKPPPTPWPGANPHKAVTIQHDATCPVSRPDFRLPTLPDGTVDMEECRRNPQCTCDFMPRLRSFMTATHPPGEDS